MDLNHRSLDLQSSALTNLATGAYLLSYLSKYLIVIFKYLQSTFKLQSTFCVRVVWRLFRTKTYIGF